MFILTHGRPDNVVTVKTLEKHGYTGSVFLVIDDEDTTASKYYEKYGDQVIMFSKEEVSKTFDEGDNFEDRRTITYARNACFQIARNLGFTYFIELDDDYVDFRYKFDHSFEYINRKNILSLDTIFLYLLNFYKKTPAKSIGISQGGDFLGGKNGSSIQELKTKGPKRKCMNSFICSTERPFTFFGRFNEDVNTYTLRGLRGEFFMTIPNIALQQKASQSNSGGITELYKNFGTYVKSFMTVMYAPSCTKVKMMRSRHPRLHHAISWRNAVPVILREEHKKR